MNDDPITSWTSSLRVPRRKRQAIARELRAHLVEAQQELELAGWTTQEAERESIRRLGDPAELAQAFTHVHSCSRRKQFGAAFALASALLVGAYGASGTLASATAAHRQPHHAQQHSVHRHHRARQHQRR